MNSKEDFEKFKNIHLGKNRTEHWIKQYELVLTQYPLMRIYGWHKAIKWYCEYHDMDYVKPRFHPDLYLVCSEVIVAFEIEDRSRWSESKQTAMMNWYINMDNQEAIDFYIYRFDGYGNCQGSIFPNASEQLDMLEDCPAKHKEWFESVSLNLLHMEQETLLDIKGE